MTAPAPALASRVMRARRSSTCPVCRGPVQVGEQIARVGRQWQHVSHVLEQIRSQRELSDGISITSRRYSGRDGDDD